MSSKEDSERKESAAAQKEPKSTAQKLEDRVERAKSVALNKEISAYARQKNLTGAMESFRTAQEKGWLNTHTFSGIINAHIRCGDVEGAESMFRLLQRTKGVRMDVISCTTMLKGYSSVGNIAAARQLMEDMFAANPKVMPNVRTVNTFLRGCLLAGSVQESETMLAHCQRTFALTPDASTWEYVVTLLCQGLRVDKAAPLVGRLRGDASLSLGGGVRGMLVSLARACALLGEDKTCLRALRGATELLEKEEAEDVRDELRDELEDEDEDEEQGRGEREVTGGKRAWKTRNTEEEGEEATAREQSLEVQCATFLFAFAAAAAT
jgi:pentatricopeptide repeat protein